MNLNKQTRKGAIKIQKRNGFLILKQYGKEKLIKNDMLLVVKIKKINLSTPIGDFSSNGN